MRALFFLIASLLVGGLCTPLFAQNIAPNNYDVGLEQSTESIAQVIQSDVVGQRGEGAVNTMIFKVITNIIIPLVIFGGIFLAILGFYKITTSSNADDMTTGWNYFIWGVIGVITMVSARFIGFTLWKDLFEQGLAKTINGVDLAEKIYSQILYPFIKLGMYLVIGVLFWIVIIKSYKYITNDEDTNQKTTLNAILANIIGIFLIIGSKEIIEAIYGKRQQVINTAFENVNEIGTAIFAVRNIPLYFQIITRFMGLVAIIILIFLLYQGFKLLVDPESDESIDETKKYMLYATIGVLVLGTCYVLTNALIVSGTS